jgi:hypothetical protein
MVHSPPEKAMIVGVIPDVPETGPRRQQFDFLGERDRNKGLVIGPGV